MAVVALTSIKGSPGVTSAALVLAAVWPRPVVLLEADLAGGDLAFRAQAASGGPVHSTKGLLTLASRVRGGGSVDPRVLMEQSQMLACGVSLIRGVTSAAQARGLSWLWPNIAAACVNADVDVIVDLGRVDRASDVMELVKKADYLLPVASTSLESVMHLTEGLQDLMGTLSHAGVRNVAPLLVGDQAHAARDASDLDGLLGRAGLPVMSTLSLPTDAKALGRLEAGEKPDGRLGRSSLIKTARVLAQSLAARISTEDTYSTRLEDVAQGSSVAEEEQERTRANGHRPVPPPPPAPAGVQSRPGQGPEPEATSPWIAAIRNHSEGGAR
ncbi:hypothetical protein ACFVBP_21610 [Nocardioides sp. NPDC057764]|uniref:hypothetical protein n=1 Tax=Nocardioides sp. NPDC057764 TaxID=3346243 RepID=UPI00366D3E5A